MRMKQFFPVKMTAWVLSIFMLLSSMGDGGVLYAAQPQAVSNSSVPFNLSELQVPEKFGEISEKSGAADSKPSVILIQDAHAIPDAQKNIHALIRHFEKKHGVKNVALEGASSELDPQFFRSFPDQKLLKKIFKDYYERAELSGAAAASVFAETDVRFQGVEDWPLYEQALLDYLRALESESLVLARLKGLRADLNLAKQKNYSPELLKADRAWEDFEENQTQILETIKVLASIKKPAAGSLIELLMRVEPQGETGQGQDHELKAAVEVVRAGLNKNPAAPKKELMELNRCLQAYQTGEMNAQEFAVRIKKLAEGLGLALQFSRPLRELSAMQMRLESMRGTKLLKEFEVYAADIKRELVERETDLPRKEAIRVTEKQSQKIRLIEKLARLELSHDEWNQIQSIRRGSPEGEEGELRLIDLSLLEANLSFYENSVEREKAFMRNVRKLLPKPTSDTRPVILVAGGFHTQGMAERFKKEGLSYAVVTPKIERLPEVNSYRKHMAGDVSWKSYFKFEGNRVRPYDAFARSVRDQLLSQDIDAAKVWRDEIIRDLADQGRAQDAWKYTKFIDETQSRDGRRNRSPREGVAERLSRRVDQFVSGLRSLYVSGNFNQKSVAGLLRSMNAVAAVTGPAMMVPGASIPTPAALALPPQPRDENVSESAREDYSKWISELEQHKADSQYSDFQMLALRMDALNKTRVLNRSALYDFWSALREGGSNKLDVALSSPDLLGKLLMQKISAVKSFFAEAKSAQSPQQARAYVDQRGAYIMRQAAQAMALMSVIEAVNKNESEKIKAGYGDWLRGLDVQAEPGENLTMADVYQQESYATFDDFRLEELSKNQGANMRDEVLAELATYGSPQTWIFSDDFDERRRLVPNSLSADQKRSLSEELSKMSLGELFATARDHHVFEFDTAEAALEKFITPSRKASDHRILRLNHHFQVLRQDRNRLILREILYRWGSADRPRSHTLFQRSEARSNQVVSGEAVVTAHDILHRLIRRGNREINPVENPENFLRLRQKWIQAVHQLLVWRSHYFPKSQFNVELEYVEADGSRGLARVGDLNNLFGIPPKPFDHLYPQSYEIDPKQMEDIVNFDQPLTLNDALELLPNEGMAKQNLLYLQKAIQKNGYQIMGDLRLAGEGRIAFYVSGGFKHLPFSVEQPRRFEQLALKVNGAVIASEEYQLPPEVDIGTAIGHFFVKLAKGSSVHSRILAVGRELQKMPYPVVSIFDIDETLVATDGTPKVDRFSELLEVLQTDEHVAGVITHRGIVVEKESAGYDGKDILDFSENDKAELLEALKGHEKFKAIWKDLEPVGVGMNDLDFFSTGFFYNDSKVGLYLRVKNPDKKLGERDFFEALIPVTDPQVGVSKLISAKLIHAIYAEKYGKTVFKDAFLMMVGDHLLFDHSMMRENGEGFVPKHNLFLEKQRGHLKSDTKLNSDTLFPQGMASVVVPVMRHGENGMAIRFESSGVAPQNIAFSDQMMTPQSLPFVDLPTAILKVLRHARKNPQTTVITIPPLLSRDQTPPHRSEMRSKARYALGHLAPKVLRSLAIASVFGMASISDLKAESEVETYRVSTGELRTDDKSPRMAAENELIVVEKGNFLTSVIQGNQCCVVMAHSNQKSLPVALAHVYPRNDQDEYLSDAEVSKYVDNFVDVLNGYGITQDNGVAYIYANGISYIALPEKIQDELLSRGFKVNQFKVFSGSEFSGMHFDGEIDGSKVYFEAGRGDGMLPGDPVLEALEIHSDGQFARVEPRDHGLFYVGVGIAFLALTLLVSWIPYLLYRVAKSVLFEEKSFFQSLKEHVRSDFDFKTAPTVESDSAEDLTSEGSGPALLFSEDEWLGATDVLQRAGMLEIYFKEYFDGRTGLSPSYSFTEAEYQSDVKPFLESLENLVQPSENPEIVFEAFEKLNNAFEQKLVEMLYWLAQKLEATPRYRKPSWEAKAVRDMFQNELFSLFHDLLVWMEPGQQNRKGFEDLRGSMELVIEALGEYRLSTFVYPVEWNDLPGLKDSGAVQRLQALQKKAGEILDVDKTNDVSLDKYFKELERSLGDLESYVAAAGDQLANHEIYRLAYSVLLAAFFLNDEVGLESERIVLIFQKLAKRLHEELLQIAEAESLVGSAIDVELRKFEGNLSAARAAIDLLEDLHPTPTTMSRFVLSLMIQETDLIRNGKSPFRSEARKLDWNDDSSATSERLNRFVNQIKRNKIQWPQANHSQSLLSFDVEAGASMELTNHGPESHRATRLPGQLLLVRPGTKVLNAKDFAQLEKEPTHTLRRAQGALGWVRVSEMTLDGEPILYINEVQSSAGFHALWKRFKSDKNNLRWAAAAVESITQAAQASGYKIIVAKNHRTARLENPNRPGSDKTWQLISDGALQEVYKRPFKGWQETEIEHSTGWKTTAWIKELKEPLLLVKSQSPLERWWSEMLAKLKPFWFRAQVNRGPAPAVTENNVAVSLEQPQGRAFLDEGVVQDMRAAIGNKKNLNQIMGALEFPVTKSGTRLRLHKTILGLGAFEIEMKAPGQEDWVTLPMSRLNFKEKSDEIILDDIAIDNEFKFVGQGMGSTLFAYLHEYARLTQKSIRIPSTENYWLGFAVYKNWGRDATYEAPDRTRQPLREVYANPPKEIIVEIHAPVRERSVFKYQNGAYVRSWEPWMESGDTLSPKLELSWENKRLVLTNPVADMRFGEAQYSMYWPQSIANIVIQPKATDGRSESRAAPEFIYTDDAGRKRIKVDSIPDGITKRFLQSLIQSNSQRKVFLVGGAVRDLIMGQEPNDLDLLTDGLDSQGIPSEFEGLRVADMGDFERRDKGVSFDRADFLQKPELSINRLLLGFDDQQDPYLEEKFSPQGYADLLSETARLIHAETRQSYFTISLMAPRLVEKIKKYNLTFDSETKQVLEAVLRSQSAFLEMDRAEMSDTDLEVYDALKALQEMLKPSSADAAALDGETQVRSEMRYEPEEIELAKDVQLFSAEDQSRLKSPNVALGIDDINTLIEKFPFDHKLSVIKNTYDRATFYIYARTGPQSVPVMKVELVLNDAVKGRLSIGADIRRQDVLRESLYVGKLGDPEWAAQNVMPAIVEAKDQWFPRMESWAASRGFNEVIFTPIPATLSDPDNIFVRSGYHYDKFEKVYIKSVKRSEAREPKAWLAERVLNANGSRSELVASAQNAANQLDGILEESPAWLNQESAVIGAVKQASAGNFKLAVAARIHRDDQTGTTTIRHRDMVAASDLLSDEEKKLVAGTDPKSLSTPADFGYDRFDIIFPEKGSAAPIEIILEPDYLSEKARGTQNLRAALLNYGRTIAFVDELMRGWQSRLADKTVLVSAHFGEQMMQSFSQLKTLGVVSSEGPFVRDFNWNADEKQSGLKELIDYLAGLEKPQFLSGAYYSTAMPEAERTAQIERILGEIEGQAVKLKKDVHARPRDYQPSVIDLTKTLKQESRHAKKHDLFVRQAGPAGFDLDWPVADGYITLKTENLKSAAADSSEELHAISKLLFEFFDLLNGNELEAHLNSDDRPLPFSSAEWQGWPVHEHLGVYQDKIHPEIVRAVESLIPQSESGVDLKVADLGGGEGNLLAALDQLRAKRIRFQFRLLEKESANVETAQSRAWKSPIEFMQGDVNETIRSIPDGENDFVINSGGILNERVGEAQPENLNAYMAQMHRILKPGGYAILTGLSPLMTEYFRIDPAMWEVVNASIPSNFLTVRLPAQFFILKKKSSAMQSLPIAQRSESRGQGTRYEVKKIGEGEEELQANLYLDPQIRALMNPWDQRMHEMILKKGSDFLIAIKQNSELNAFYSKPENANLLPRTSGLHDIRRTVIMPLRYPLTYQGQVYTALKIKGVLIRVGQVLDALDREATQQSTHAIGMKNGQPTHTKPRNHPQGTSLFDEDVLKELFAREYLSQQEFSVEPTLGFSEYTNIQFGSGVNAEAVGTISLLLTDVRDIRLGRQIGERLAADLKKYSDKSFSDADAGSAKEFYMKAILGYVRLMRRLNAVGVHKNANMSNISADESIRLTDLESFNAHYEIPAEDRYAYLMHDFEAMLGDILSVVGFDDNRNNQQRIDFFKAIGFEGAAPEILKAYFLNTHENEFPNITKLAWRELRIIRNDAASVFVDNDYNPDPLIAIFRKEFASEIGLPFDPDWREKRKAELGVSAAQSTDSVTHRRSEMREMVRVNSFSDQPGRAIESELFVDSEVYELLLTEDKMLIEEVLTLGKEGENKNKYKLKGVRPIGTSGAFGMKRSFIVPLSNPITVKNVEYDAVIIKGIMLDPSDNGAVQILNFDSAGQPREKVDVLEGKIVYSPSRLQALGGLPWQHAQDETAASLFFNQENGFPYSSAYPLAYGQITNKYLQLDTGRVDLGYEIQLVQAERMTDSAYGEPIFDEIRLYKEVLNQLQDAQKFGLAKKIDQSRDAAERVTNAVAATAAMLRKFQKIGKHGSFNLTNIAVWHEEQLAIRDLTHFKKWSEVGSPADRFAYAFLDLKTLILGYRDIFHIATQSAVNMGMQDEEDGSYILSLYGNEVFNAFIQSYFHPELQARARAVLSLYETGDFEKLSVRLQQIADQSANLALLDSDDPFIEILKVELQRDLDLPQRSELRFDSQRQDFLEWAQDFEKQYRAEVAATLAKSDSELSPEQKSKELSLLTDKKIRIIFDLAPTFVEGLAGHEQDWPFALVATGTYARNELARGSDRDGLILYPRAAGEEAYKPLLEYFYYAMLNGLNFSAGWPQIAADDIETRNLTAEEVTEMIDARPIAGSDAVVKEFTQKYHRYLQGDFKNPTKDPQLEDITTNIQFLNEHLIKFWHENRVKRGFYDGSFEREPNLKWGSGGFRDMDFSRWILKIMAHRSAAEKAKHPDMVTELEMREAEEAYRYLRNVRWMLHEERMKQKKPLTEKVADILSFEFQQTLADQLYPEILDPQARLEKMISKLQSANQTLYLFASNIFRRALHQTGSLNYTPLGNDGKPRWAEGLEADGIELVKRTGKTVFLDTGLKHVVDQVTLTIHPNHSLKAENILKLFQYAAEHKLAMTGELLDEITRRLPGFRQWVKENPGLARAEFLKLRETPQALGYLIFRMHALGVLTDLIPEFNRISSKATLDIKHRETLDIYAIKSLGVLDQILGLKFWEDKPHALAEKLLTEAQVVKSNPEQLRLIRDALLAQPLADFMPEQVQALVKELGYDDESQKNNLVWLIENRDALINFIRRGGMNDPQMFKEFRDQKLEGDYQRWVLLLLLTVTRMDFFNPGRKKIFSEVLQPLMGLTEDQFKNDKEIQSRFSQTQYEIQQLADEGSSAASGKLHKTSVDLALRFIEGSDQFLQVDVVLDPHWNRPGTLLRIAAVFVKHNLSVQNMQIGLVRNGATGDRFIVKLRNPADSEEVPQMEKELREVLRREIMSLIVDPAGKSYQAYLKGRSKAYASAKPNGAISLEVAAENGKKSTFIHLKMEDGPEILFNAARLFERYGLNIMDKSTLDTEGAAEDYKGLRVVDTFEVQKNDGPLDDETIKELTADMYFLFSSPDRDAAFQNLPSRRGVMHKKIYEEIDELFRAWQFQRQHQSYNLKEMEFYFPSAGRFSKGRYKSLRNFLDAFYRVTAPWIEELGYSDRYDYFRRQVSALEVGLASSDPYLKDAVRLGILPPIMTDSGVVARKEASLPYWSDFSRDLNQFIGAMLDHAAEDLGPNFKARPLSRSEFRMIELPVRGGEGEARIINRLIYTRERDKKVTVADFMSALKQYLLEKQKNQRPEVQFEIGDSVAFALRDAIARASEEGSKAADAARRGAAQMISGIFGINTPVDDVVWALFNAEFWEWLFPDWKILKRQNDGDISPHQYYTGRHLVQVLMNSERLAFSDAADEIYATEERKYEKEILLEYQRSYKAIAQKGTDTLASFRLGVLVHDIGKAKDQPTAYAPSHMSLGAEMIPLLFAELGIDAHKIPSDIARDHQYLNAALSDVLSGRKTYEQLLMELADLSRLNLDYLNMLFMISMADYLGVFRIPSDLRDVRGLLTGLGIYGQSLQSIYAGGQPGLMVEDHPVMKLVHIRRQMEAYWGLSTVQQMKIRQEWGEKIQLDHQRFKDELEKQGVHPDVLESFPAWYLMRLHHDSQKREVSNVMKLDRFYRQLISPEMRIGTFKVKNRFLVKALGAVQRAVNGFLKWLKDLFQLQAEWMDGFYWDVMEPLHFDSDLYSIHDNRYMNIWVGLPEDRPGLLAAMTAALAARKLNVQQAFVKTIGGKVFNHFLVSYKRDELDGGLIKSETLQDQMDSFLRQDLQKLMQGHPDLYQERLSQYIVEHGVQSFGRPVQEGDEPRIEIEFKNLDGTDALTYEVAVQSDRDQPWFLHRLTRMIAAMRGNILSNAQILTRDRGEIDNRLVVSFPVPLSGTQIGSLIALMKRGLSSGIAVDDFLSVTQEISKVAAVQRSEARYPDPAVDTQSKDLAHYSYLERYQKQWVWIKENALEDMVRRARADANNSSHPELNITVMGASTGEEIARTFHEMVTWLEGRGEKVALNENENGWRIKITGIEKNSEIAAAAEKRIAGQQPFWVAASDEKSQGRQYARTVMETLNRFQRIFKQFVQIKVGDVTQSASLNLPQPHLILANSVFYQIERGQVEKVIQGMDEKFPQAWIAMTNDASFKPNPLKHSLLGSTNQGPADAQDYMFLAPLRSEAREVQEYLPSDYSHNETVLGGTAWPARVYLKMLNPQDGLEYLVVLDRFDIGYSDEGPESYDVYVMPLPDGTVPTDLHRQIEFKASLWKRITNSFYAVSNYKGNIGFEREGGVLKIAPNSTGELYHRYPWMAAMMNDWVERTKSFSASDLSLVGSVKKASKKQVNFSPRQKELMAWAQKAWGTHAPQFRLIHLSGKDYVEVRGGKFPYILLHDYLFVDPEFWKKVPAEHAPAESLKEKMIIANLSWVINGRGREFLGGAAGEAALIFMQIHAEMFPGKTVLDAGARGGAAGLLALRLGARRVIFSENNGLWQVTAAENFKQNGFNWELQGGLIEDLSDMDPNLEADVVLSHMPDSGYRETALGLKNWNLLLAGSVLPETLFILSADGSDLGLRQTEEILMQDGWQRSSAARMDWESLESQSRTYDVMFVHPDHAVRGRHQDAGFDIQIAPNIGMDESEVGRVFRDTKLIEKTLFRVHGMRVKKSDVEKVAITLYSDVGTVRRVFLVTVKLKGSVEEKKFIMKITRKTQMDPGTRMHEVKNFYANIVLGRRQGVLQLFGESPSTSSIIATGPLVEGVVFEKVRENPEAQSAVVEEVIRIWKKMSRAFFTDLHLHQFILAQDKADRSRFDARLIDKGVIRTPEGASHHVDLGEEDGEVVPVGVESDFTDFRQWIDRASETEILFTLMDEISLSPAGLNAQSARAVDPDDEMLGIVRSIKYEMEPRAIVEGVYRALGEEQARMFFARFFLDGNRRAQKWPIFRAIQNHYPQLITHGLVFPSTSLRPITADSDQPGIVGFSVADNGQNSISYSARVHFHGEQGDGKGTWIATEIYEWSRQDAEVSAASVADADTGVIHTTLTDYAQTEPKMMSNRVFYVPFVGAELKSFLNEFAVHAEKHFAAQTSGDYRSYGNWIASQLVRDFQELYSGLKRSESRGLAGQVTSADDLLDGFMRDTLSLSADQADSRARGIVADVEVVGLEEYVSAVERLRDEMVKGLEGEQKKQMQNLVRFFADALLQNSKSEIEIALDAPELEIALQQAIQEFAFGDGVRFVLPKTMANLKIPAAMVRRVNSLTNAVKKGGPILLSIFSAGGEGASQKSESIVDLISDEKDSYGLNEVQRQKADVLTRMLVAVLLSGKVKQRDDMNNISLLLADTGYFQNIAQGLTFKDGRLTVSMNVLMRLAQEYAATKQIQAAA